MKIKNKNTVIKIVMNNSITSYTADSYSSQDKWLQVQPKSPK